MEIKLLNSTDIDSFIPHINLQNLYNFSFLTKPNNKLKNENDD